MRHCQHYLLALLAMLVTSSVLAQNPRVWLDTDRGPIFLELKSGDAPITSENFLTYVNEGFFDGLVFHRVVDDFVIQAGGFDRNIEFREPTHPSILNEAGNGLDNHPRTVAMARATDPDSANSQFFINLVDNDFLDGGYAVFGEVILGWQTVQEIAALATGRTTTPVGIIDDVPMTPPVIHRAVQFDGEFPIMPIHSGTWFDPGKSGVGFNIEVTNMGRESDEPLVVIYWYNFNQGENLWLTGTSNFEYGATEVTIDLIGVVAPNETVDFQAPPELSAFESRGTLVLSFDDCSNARFDYDLPDYGSGELELIRLTLPDRQTCDKYEPD